jgi:WD40 repeat protein
LNKKTENHQKKYGGTMTIHKHKPIHAVLVAAILILLLPGVACNLFSAQESEPEAIVEVTTVVEEPEVIEAPEEEPEFKPEQVLRLDFEDTVRSVAYAHAGDLFATGIITQVDIWNAGDVGYLFSMQDLPHRADGLTFTPDDQQVYVALGVGGVNLYNLADGEVLIDFHRGYDNSLALAPDADRIATGNRSGETWLWDARTGDLVYEMDPADHVDNYSEYITALAYSPDGSIIATGHWDGYIFLWDASSGYLIRYIEPETDFCNAVSLDFSINGQYLAVGGLRQEREDVVKVFEVSNGSLAHALADYSRTGSMTAPVAFSADGTLLAAGATDGIFIWALPEYELLHTIPIEDTGATNWVTDLAFSPDSQHLLAGYWDNYAIQWQVQE